MTAVGLTHVFDRSGKVPRPTVAQTLREFWSLFSFAPPPPDTSDLTHGGGHVVLLVPALFTTDRVNAPLQSFLNACSFRAFGWELGINWGPTQGLVSGLRRRLAVLREIEGGPVSVVGLSLGGLFSRIGVRMMSGR